MSRSDTRYDEDEAANHDAMLGANRIHDALAARFPETYAGVRIERDDLVVSLVPGRNVGPAERAARSVQTAVPVRIEPVAHSLEGLMAGQRRVAQAIPTLLRQGVDLAAVAADIATNTVRVAFRDPSADAESLLRRDFPDIPFSVEREPSDPHPGTA